MVSVDWFENQSNHYCMLVVQIWSLVSDNKGVLLRTSRIYFSILAINWLYEIGVGFIDLVDSTKNTITMDNLEHIRKYYSKFINSTSEVIKSYSGKVIKNIGDCILFYFPKPTDFMDMEVFREIIDCGFKILDERYIVNQELSKEHLPPFNYRITIDYGVLDLALVGDYSQIDLFGTTINLCSKINSSSSLSVPNEIIIGDNFYRILKSFSGMLNNYDFINHINYQITENNRYSLYNEFLSILVLVRCSLLIL